jgi:hypothetical protein
MTKRGVLFAVGGGIAATGAAVGITAVWVGAAGVYLLCFPLVIAGGLIMGKAIRLGMPARPE